MSERPLSYRQQCFMRPIDADCVSQMIASQPQFSPIRITVNPDRESYPPFLASQIPEGKILVTFDIPYSGVCMVDFYREFARAINPGSSSMSQRERK